MQWNSKTHLYPIHAVNKNMRHLETAFKRNIYNIIHSDLREVNTLQNLSDGT